jgi:hypothetical protein
MKNICNQIGIQREFLFNFRFRSLEVIAQEGKPLSVVLKEQKSAEGSSSIGGPLRFPKCVIFWLQWDQVSTTL